MKTWEVVRCLEEGMKVRKKNWSKEMYIYFKDGELVDECGIFYNFSLKPDNWEIYDDRKECPDDIKCICNEIMKFVNTCSTSNKDFKTIEDMLYDISIMIEQLNKKYKIDE